jgi:hypothetical protein
MKDALTGETGYFGHGCSAVILQQASKGADQQKSPASPASKVIPKTKC